jgi:uncharacterized protein (DUF1778 family)
MQKEPTMIRLEPDVRRLIERAAKADQRSLSAFIRKIVTDWAKAQPPAKESRR